MKIAGHFVPTFFSNLSAMKILLIVIFAIHSGTVRAATSYDPETKVQISIFDLIEGDTSRPKKRVVDSKLSEEYVRHFLIELEKSKEKLLGCLEVNQTLEFDLQFSISTSGQLELTNQKEIMDRSPCFFEQLSSLKAKPHSWSPRVEIRMPLKLHRQVL